MYEKLSYEENSANWLVRTTCLYTKSNKLALISQQFGNKQKPFFH